MDETNSSKVIHPEAWTNLLISGTPYAGWTDSLEAAMNVIRQYEIETTSSFVCAKTRKTNFGLAGSSDFKNYRIRFNLINVQDEAEHLKFDGKPFIITNSMSLHCHRGLQKLKKSNMNRERVRKIVQPSKKVNCPAEIILKEINLFPDFAVNEASGWKRKESSLNLRILLANNPDAVKVEKRIYIYLPKYQDHRGHDCGIADEYIQRIDARLLVKLKDLVSIGVTDTKDVIYHLEQFVADNRNSWFRNGILPSKLNRRFYPTRDTVRNHINIQKKKLHDCTEDQEILKELTAATYLINDSTVMDTFHSKLLEIKSYVDSCIYKGLPSLKENQKKRKACDGSLIKLPERKKKKET